MTIPERTNYDRTSTFAEVVAVVDALGQSSDLIHRETLLLTEDGKDVPLLVLARPPIVTPAQARASGKPVIYIQGNIHGGEVEGKEASLIDRKSTRLNSSHALISYAVFCLKKKNPPPTHPPHPPPTPHCVSR